MLMGEYLRFERKKRNITMRMMAEMADVPMSTISETENSKLRNPGTIDKLLCALGLSWETALAAGVDFINETPNVEMHYQSDIEYIIEWMRSKPKAQLHQIRRMIEFMEHQNEEDSSN